MLARASVRATARKGCNMNRMLHTVHAGSLLLLALLAGAATAEPIYRSVDADGNVTFSGTPPANAVTVEELDTRAAPSAAAQREARERTQRQEAAASDLSKARAERAPQQSPAQLPAAGGETAAEEAASYHYGYPYQDPARRERVREAVRERLQERPAQLPARPVQLPARPGPR